MALADRVNISVPSGMHPEIYRHVQDYTGALGGFFESADTLRLGAGTLRVNERSRFTSFSVSGAFLHELRCQRSLSQFLFPFGEGPHRVTMLHIAQDYPVDAPRPIRELKRRAVAGTVKLTRKAVRPSQVLYMESHNHTEPGVSTGMLYIGSPNAEVRAAVYDKRNERIHRGHDDPGPLLRAELRVTGKMGLSLKDVVQPDPCYWHFMSDIFPRPDNIAPWSPHDDDYRLEPPVDLEPYQILQRSIETSPEVQRMLELAERMGPDGFRTLVRLLERRATASPVQPAASIEAA